MTSDSEAELIDLYKIAQGECLSVEYIYYQNSHKGFSI